MKKTGLFFGTFNPVHNGHIAIADYMATQTDLDEVWLVVSPQNPLKKKEDLLADEKRLELVKLAIKNHAKLKASDMECKLPKPSYTIHTLSFLRKKYPNQKFALIIGEDNLRNFHRWKEYQKILDEFEIYVYPRANINTEKDLNLPNGGLNHRNIKKFDLKLLDISATQIRTAIKQGKDISRFLPPNVAKQIKLNYFKIINPIKKE